MFQQGSPKGEAQIGVRGMVRDALLKYHRCIAGSFYVDQDLAQFHRYGNVLAILIKGSLKRAKGSAYIASPSQYPCAFKNSAYR